MDFETSKSTDSNLPQHTSSGKVSSNSDVSSVPDLPSQRRTLIKSQEKGVQLDLGELWRSRELLYFLTLRDIKVRYKQTLMGVGWVLIQPLLTVLIFTLVFNRFVRLETGSLPYPLFAFSGLLLWLFFATAVTNSTHSLVSNANLITKVYFPRMFLPAASVGAGLVDLSVAFALLIVMCFYYGVGLTLNALLLPFFIFLMALLALGVGLISAAVTVKYRDLRHALPFVIQLWMFASPVIYPASIVPEKWKWMVLLNPVAGIIEGFRASLTGSPLNWMHVSISAAITLMVLVCSLYVFRRFEHTFADVV